MVPEVHRGSSRKDTRVVQGRGRGRGRAGGGGAFVRRSVFTGCERRGTSCTRWRGCRTSGRAWRGRAGLGGVAGGGGPVRGGGGDRVVARGHRGAVRGLSRTARRPRRGLSREQGPGGGRERRAGAAGVEDDPLDVRGVCPGPCDRPRVRRTAARCGGVREWRTGHSPSGGRPGLAGLVREVLAGLGGTAWRRTRAPLRADSCAGAPQGEGGRRRGLGGGRGAGRRLPPEDPRPSRSPPIPTPPAPGGRPPLTRSSARPATGARGAARRRRTVLPRRHPRTRCRTSFVRRSKVVRSRASALRRRRGSVLEGRRLNHQSGVVTVRPSRVSAVAPGWSA
ncbi:hypothetical protein EES47_13605 [Streptomyces sp. ADI98-12]|nr:hypothetical protein EES47_13605 [Streptomyces sp. ADI98-12]